jgi:hypothetical protein
MGPAMINRLPRLLPPLSSILDDIGRPEPRQLARALGVSERTIRRWIAHDRAPRTAHLSLYWLTRWGMSAVDAEATNNARMYAGLADAYLQELKQARQQLAQLLTIADFGSANDPVHSWPGMS